MLTMKEKTFAKLTELCFYEDYDFVVRCIESCEEPKQVRSPITKLIELFKVRHINDERLPKFYEELVKLRERKTAEIYDKYQKKYEQMYGNKEKIHENEE